jgi:fumarate hydratase class II
VVLLAYTGKALEVFLETGTRFPRRIIWALGLVKYAAARANASLGLLDDARAEAIVRAALEVAEGLHDDKIVVDVFQTGSGTGVNMNVNEVIADRASQISGLMVHPNDHVNMGQSSNDVVPTAIRIALAYEVERGLLPALDKVILSLDNLASRTQGVVKPGRTHLRDALPVTMGQEFSAYADAYRRARGFTEYAYKLLLDIPLGGTAVGTGLNAHPDYPRLAVSFLREATGLDLRVASSKFRAMRLLSDIVAVSSAFKVIALDTWRLCQDLRLMYSGPNTGFNEIDIPQEIAGSSMMPGKVNPVTIEAVMQASSHVVGLDNSITMASLLGELELSMGIPLAGYASIRQAMLLAESLNKLAPLVLDRIKPNVERARKLAESSQALITVLAPIIGYDRASEISKAVYKGKTIKEALREAGVPEDLISKLLDMEKLTKPGIPALEHRE